MRSASGAGLPINPGAGMPTIDSDLFIVNVDLSDGTTSATLGA